MKIIDLLVKNANGEEMPKIISFRNERYIWNEYGYYSIDSTVIDDEGDEYAPSLLHGFNLFQPNVINDDVEIIEEIEKPKKIEKIKMSGNEFYSEYIESWIEKSKYDAYCEYLSNKLNEIIDSVNYLLEKSDKDE